MNTYLRYELKRTFRNRRLVIVSLGFPLVLYFLIAAPNRNEHDLGGTGISAPVYFMVSLVAFGAMNAVLGSGIRVATERQAGWNRQLRLTPLTTRAYFRTKVIVGYGMALATIASVYVAGAIVGVRLGAAHWVEMTLLILVGLVPFAALGILLGHLVSSDSIGPTIGGVTALLSFLGGVWFPVGSSGVLHYVAQALPSYWLVQASHVGIGGGGWSGTGWIVIFAWTAIAARLAMRAYARDTGRG
ncbi:MAG TPA: ABC transporter permease [Gaiellaceae bacterium]|nr:ABC transporter permease [Gaiellaceae bacterium]